MQRSRFHATAGGAAGTVLALFGGLLIAMVASSATTAANGPQMPSPGRITLASTVFIVIMLAASGVWGVWMGRIAHTSAPRRMAVAGMLGVVPITLCLGIALAILEPIAVTTIGARLPLYRLFTLLFVPATWLIASTGSMTLGRALGGNRLGWTLAARTGITAALAFLSVNLLMEAFGWHVGGPGAAEHFTMLTVLFVSDLGAALAAGVIIGLTLGQVAAQQASSLGTGDGTILA
ncbi:MAG: hypothetical protein NVS4B8_30930 [Herpetosiphon sp.]